MKSCRGWLGALPRFLPPKATGALHLVEGLPDYIRQRPISTLRGNDGALRYPDYLNRGFCGNPKAGVRLNPAINRGSDRCVTGYDQRVVHSQTPSDGPAHTGAALSTHGTLAPGRIFASSLRVLDSLGFNLSRHQCPNCLIEFKRVQAHRPKSLLRLLWLRLGLLVRLLPGAPFLCPGGRTVKGMPLCTLEPA
jgi:hypothetical protein